MVYPICKPRNYPEGGTPFGNWIRRQEGLESNTRVGYVGTDLDMVWYNYVKAMLMILEIKCKMEEVGPSQEAVEYIFHQCLQFAMNSPDFVFRSLRKPIPPKITYCGSHLIQFENTSPEDGATYIDGVRVNRQQLMDFLQFKWTPSIQCYLEQQELIRSAHSTARLAEVAEQIKRSIRSSHPEIRLLRTLWHAKKQELAQMEMMFSTHDEPADQEEMEEGNA